MRNRFAQRVLERAGADPSLWLLTGDLGYSVLEPFAAAHPGRFVNAGVAEQNMAGLAAGLALSGKKVFAFSIVNFAVTRCLEQIRNDIAYHGADVCIVAVGGGVAYGSLGYTHWGVEDLAFMRSLGGMRVYCPADRLELDACMDEILAQPGPSYLRLARGGEPDIHTAPPRLDAGLIELAPAQPLTVLACGTVLGEALKAQRALAAKGRPVGLYSVPHMGPSAEAALAGLAGRCERLVTVEEHHVVGGLGSYASECVGAWQRPVPVKRLGLRPGGLERAGSQAWMRSVNGLDAAALEAELGA